MNLVGNAVKFTQRAKWSSASRAGVEAARPWLRFEVARHRRSASSREDRGDLPAVRPGRHVDHARVWRHRARTRPSPRQLVTLMGGDFGVKSRPGEGTHVLVHYSARARPLGRLWTGYRPSRSRRALGAAVDDNAVARGRALRLSRRLGHGSVARGGERRTDADGASRDAVDGRPFAHGLLDRSMPGMGGERAPTTLIAPMPRLPPVGAA